MKGAEPTTSPERLSPLRFLGALLFHNWGLKIIAFALAVLMFVFTRDEVTRGFTVPLKVVMDPERVLLTELPSSIKVQARGPWTRINRLQDYDFGAATLDLKDAGPGPLEVDEAAIVMPSGVLLSSIVYDHVDLRFDPVIEREVDVAPAVTGEPAPDYELVRIEVQPTRVRVRGGESFVGMVDQVTTEALEIQGAEHDVEATRALRRPPAGVEYVAESRGDAVVTVRAIVNPKEELRRVAVPVAVSPEFDPTGAVPRSYEVEISGPLPDFRVLDVLGVEPLVQAEVRPVEGDERVLQVRFSWAEGVPPDFRERLALDRTADRIELPQLPREVPEPPEPLEPG